MKKSQISINLAIILAILIILVLFSLFFFVERKVEKTSFKIFKKTETIPLLEIEEQEGFNLFNNFVKGFEECSKESNCFCDIYKLKFPKDYKIFIENSNESILLQLINPDGEVLISEKIDGVKIGKLQKDFSCLETEAVEVSSDGEELYIDGIYRLAGRYELFRSGKNICFIINKTGVNFESEKNFPRCKYKIKKKREIASNYLEKISQMFKKCALTVSYTHLTLPTTPYV